MEKEEKISKISLLKSFCAQNGISVDELYELPSLMKIIKAGSPFDIYYEDGEITRRIDLTKNPIAFRISLLPSERNVWVSASVLKEANFGQAQAYLKSLPKISSYSWRIPDENEITLLLENNLKNLSKLRYVFSLPYFMEASEDNEQGILGCLDAYHKLNGALYYYPGAFVRSVGSAEKLTWWSVCDAD